VYLHHKGEACILKTKFLVTAYAKNKWLIMFLRAFGRRRPPTSVMLFVHLSDSSAKLRCVSYLYLTPAGDVMIVTVPAPA
jgi:hypothetical protein